MFTRSANYFSPLIIMLLPKFEQKKKKFLARFVGEILVNWCSIFISVFSRQRFIILTSNNNNGNKNQHFCVTEEIFFLFFFILWVFAINLNLKYKPELFKLVCWQHYLGSASNFCKYSNSCSLNVRLKRHSMYLNYMSDMNVRMK